LLDRNVRSAGAAPPSSHEHVVVDSRDLTRSWIGPDVRNAACFKHGVREIASRARVDRAARPLKAVSNA